MGSLSDVVLGFFGEEEEKPGSPEDYLWEDYVLDGEESDNSPAAAERLAFWESQNQLLKAALSSSSPLESKVRRATENAVRKVRSEGLELCSCSGNVGNKECRKCLLKSTSSELRVAGFDCGLCKSKWKSSDGIPAGEHIYLDVVHKPSNKKVPVRVLIEPNFRAEFEMARASKDYTSLISSLPEVYVGKPEKLKNVIKVVCTAAKRCMKENNMHLAPWRKHKYMQAKWLGGSSERVVDLTEKGGFSDIRKKPRTSMLTFDPLERLPAGLHYNAVEVV